MGSVYPSASSPSTTEVPDAEQVRRRAIAQAQSRGKWVAGRRLMMRQTWHTLWTAIFPAIGLLVSIASLILLIWSLWHGRTALDSLRYLDGQETAIVSSTQSTPSTMFKTLQLDRQLSRQAVAVSPTGADPLK